ncbi:hypothetical protein N8312_01880, partial [bacterium]|nr:hypothetical protein [bacterium]
YQINNIFVSSTSSMSYWLSILGTFCVLVCQGQRLVPIAKICCREKSLLIYLHGGLHIKCANRVTISLWRALDF